MIAHAAAGPTACRPLPPIDPASVAVGADTPDLAMFHRPRRPVDRFFVLGFNRRSAGDRFEVIKQAQVETLGPRPAHGDIAARLRGVAHGLVLATCCRVEFHGLLAPSALGGEGDDACGDALIEDFLALFGFDRGHHPMLDLRQGEDAIEHVLWTCLGGDSIIPGETEIVGQLKQAYAGAQAAGVLGGAAILHRIYQRVFFLCKRLRRSHLPASTRSMSLPKLVLAEIAADPHLDPARRGWGDLRLGIVGAGEMGLAFGRHLLWRGVPAERLTFFVHHPGEATRRAGFPAGAQALGLRDLAPMLRAGAFDVLLGAAGAGTSLGDDLSWQPVVGRLLIVDVSVPPLLAEGLGARLDRARSAYVGFSRLADRQQASNAAALGALADIRALVRDHAVRLAANCDRRDALPRLDLESIRPALVASLAGDAERELLALLRSARPAAEADGATPSGPPLATLRAAAARLATAAFLELRRAALRPASGEGSRPDAPPPRREDTATDE